MRKRPARTARLEMRLTPEQKYLLEEASRVRGQDVSSFALGTLMRECDEVLKRAFIRIVSERDMRAILAALEKPRKPNAALRRAFRRYKDVVEGGDPGLAAWLKRLSKGYGVPKSAHRSPRAGGAASGS